MSSIQNMRQVRRLRAALVGYKKDRATYRRIAGQSKRHGFTDNASLCYNVADGLTLHIAKIESVLAIRTNS